MKPIHKGAMTMAILSEKKLRGAARPKDEAGGGMNDSPGGA